ncbi:AI-2E family transporter [Larkinella rosea]|uniref:AI-2E family transporter n=1 Tax=Larkinella rosea TaxID=2025312 RepID=A0A3P1BU37_9BACT|nr:AI-2E family transporter [Larkinella rosea]RRB04439.1 AI-2E family transporter [Larkinella rosea]
MPSATPPPFYHRLSHSLLAIGLLMAAFYLGQDIIVPFAMAGLLAVLLRPVEAWLIRRGIPKVVAISLALFLAVAVLVGLTMLISMQISRFADDWPKLQKNLSDFYKDARRWIRQEYNLSYSQQDQYLKKAQAQTMDTLQGSDTLGVITGPLGTLLLLPIYVFLLLYYRSMLIQFIIRSFASEHTERVREVLGEIRSVIQSYVVGLVTETACVAVLNSVGLLVLGVQYAVLMGVIAAILNLIPYIGGLVATGLAVAVTFVNHPEPATLLGVVGVFLVVQFIDNNFLVPVIIGSKVRINALVSIVAVLIGGALAGVSGMFLSIPTIAIMKVIFDRVEGMEPWGILLGDQTSEEDINKMLRLRRRKKKVPVD